VCNPENIELITRKIELQQTWENFKEIWASRLAVVIDDIPWKFGFDWSKWGPSSLEQNLT